MCLYSPLFILALHDAGVLLTTQRYRQSALNLTALVGHLRTQLQHLSSLSVQYMKLHKMSVENSRDEVEDSITALNALMQKTDTLNTELYAMRQLYDHVKQCRRLLEALEPAVATTLLQPASHHDK